MRAVNRQPGFRAGGHVETEQPQAMWRHCAFTRSPNATASAPSQCFCISAYISFAFFILSGPLSAWKNNDYEPYTFPKSHVNNNPSRKTTYFVKAMRILRKACKNTCNATLPLANHTNNHKNLISNETYAPIWMLRMTQQNANAHT